jgi:hypothetical protein
MGQIPCKTGPHPWIMIGTVIFLILIGCGIYLWFRYIVPVLVQLYPGL